MPRIFERAHVLESIQDTIETSVCSYLLASESEEEEAEEQEEDIEDLLEGHEIVTSHRYLTRDTSAGRLDIDILEACIREYPETAFLALFRMHRESFWQLVEVLTKAGGEKYWDSKPGRIPRPIYHQIAVALYILGGAGTGERARIALNIGYGTVWTYTWRTAELLYKLIPDYIRWPQHPRDSHGHRIFRDCIGFLDGSDIVLRYKPMIKWHDYFSRKKHYGFNLQAICN